MQQNLYKNKVKVGQKFKCYIGVDGKNRETLTVTSIKTSSYPQEKIFIVWIYAKDNRGKEYYSLATSNCPLFSCFNPSNRRGKSRYL